MLRLPYLRITPAIAAVSSYTTCSVLSILSAVAITSFASFHPQEEPPHITTHSTPTTQNILHVCCILYDLIFPIPPTKVLHFSDICKQNLSMYCILSTPICLACFLSFFTKDIAKLLGNI